MINDFLVRKCKRKRKNCRLILLNMQPNTYCKSLVNNRKKRGRGSIGPMMDETGPYLPAENRPFQSCDTRERKVILGPERPPSLTQGSDNQDGPRIRKDYMKKHCKNDKKTEKKRKRDRH